MTTTIKLKVSFPAWGVSVKSWYLLTKRSENGVGFTCGVWIPKSVCNLEESSENGVGILTLPFWLYQKKKKEGVEFTNLENQII